MSGKNTYKQELIRQIKSKVRKGSLTAIPEDCLSDMSTRSLVSFLEWITPVVEEVIASGRASVRLLPPKKGDE